MEGLISFLVRFVNCSMRPGELVYYAEPRNMKSQAITRYSN